MRRQDRKVSARDHVGMIEGEIPSRIKTPLPSSGRGTDKFQLGGYCAQMKCQPRFLSLVKAFFSSKRFAP